MIQEQLLRQDTTVQSGTGGSLMPNLVPQSHGARCKGVAWEIFLTRGRLVQ
jgi:hypothetical protein